MVSLPSLSFQFYKVRLKLSQSFERYKVGIISILQSSIKTSFVYGSRDGQDKFQFYKVRLKLQAPL